MQPFGERLRQARLSAGLSMRELAGRAGPLSAMSISKYEQGRAVPGSDIQVRLAKALGVKVGYFHRPLCITSVAASAFRKRSRLGKKEEGAITARVLEKLERYLLIEEILAPGQPPAFSRRTVSKKRLTKVSDAEEYARELREKWDLGDGPIANLCETLEDHGVKVVLVEGVDDRFDGYSCWVNDNIPVIASRSGDDLPGDRQRFNLARELGHLLLQGEKGVDPERACHRFAGAFLVPREAVFKEVGKRRRRVSMPELLSLKHKWGLSMSAWIRRMKDQDIIPESKYVSLMKEFRTKGWHNEEPGRQVAPEKAERFERLVRRALVEDIISTGRAADLLNKPLSEVRRELTGLHGR